MSKYWKIEDDFVDISDKFIYEVDLFKYQDKTWNLEDTKLYACDEFIEVVISFQKWVGVDYKVFKFTTLISAPLKWLEQNAKLVEYETPKEKRKRKLLEKQNESKEL
jgi:hypothetical protein